MAITLHAESIRSLPEINGFVHDCWFNLKDIRWNQDSAVLEIKFSHELPSERKTIRSFFYSSKNPPQYETYFLKIFNVITHQIHDTEQIERYDFNKLIYDEKNRKIIVSTGIPVKIEAQVEKLNVTVENGGQATDVNN